VAKKRIEPHIEAPDLGVGSGLGLPLPPKARGRVYRLPPVRVVVDGRVPLPPEHIESEIETAVAAIQAGRIRFAALIRRGLQWEPGTKITIDLVQLETGAGKLAPAVVLRPSRKSSAVRVNAELRVTLRSFERFHLCIEESKDQVLLAFRHSDPATVIVLGSPTLSLLISNSWPDALR